MNNKELDNQITLVNKLATAELRSLADYCEYIEQLKKTLAQCSEYITELEQTPRAKNPIIRVLDFVKQYTSVWTQLGLALLWIMALFR
jgi:hypothetical protein